MEKTIDTEIIDFWRPNDIPGVEILDVKNSSRLYKVFHETYTVGCARSKNGSSAHMLYRGKTHRTPGNCLFHMEPGEAHVTKKVEENGSYSVLFINPELVEDMCIEMLGCKRPSIKVFNSFENDLVCEFACLIYTMRSSDSVLEKQCSLEDFLRRMFSRCAENSPKEFKRVGRLNLGDARDFLADNFEKKISLDELAEVANLSKWHLVKSFKQEYGLTPHAYQNRIRIEKIRSYLGQGRRPQEFDVGFNGQSLLIQRFKEAWGITPRSYQKMISKN